MVLLCFDGNESMVNFWEKFKRSHKTQADFVKLFSENVPGFEDTSPEWEVLLLTIGPYLKSIDLIRFETWYKLYGPFTCREDTQWVVDLYKKEFFFGELPLRVASKKVSAYNEKGGYLVTLNCEKFIPSAILTFLPKRDAEPIHLFFPLENLEQKKNLIKSIKEALPKNYREIPDPPYPQFTKKRKGSLSNFSQIKRKKRGNTTKKRQDLTIFMK